MIIGAPVADVKVDLDHKTVQETVELAIAHALTQVAAQVEVVGSGEDTRTPALAQGQVTWAVAIGQADTLLGLLAGVPDRWLTGRQRAARALTLRLRQRLDGVRGHVATATSVSDPGLLETAVAVTRWLDCTHRAMLPDTSASRRSRLVRGYLAQTPGAGDKRGHAL